MLCVQGILEAPGYSLHCSPLCLSALLSFWLFSCSHAAAANWARKLDSKPGPFGPKTGLPGAGAGAGASLAWHGFSLSNVRTTMSRELGGIGGCSARVEAFLQVV